MTTTLPAPASHAPTAAPAPARAHQGSGAAPTGATSAMGYQPALDGLRAVSVIAVICYHAGFGWAAGGFLGVEVFFVISGYLITVLLLEEWYSTGCVSLAGFWRRRARRLLPALGAVLLATAGWVAAFGSPEQVTQLRRDLPWALGYAANWGQIVGDVPYFAPESPPMLRHLWSLAVEEQWYLVWPLVFVALMRFVGDRRRIAVVLGGAVAAVATITWWVRRGAPAPFGGLFGLFDGADRTNLAYLSTVTRSSGLLLGAALAFLWRPWLPSRERLRAVADAGRPERGRALARRLALHGACVAAIAVLAVGFVTVHLTDAAMYPWVLLLVAAASGAAIAVVVHPDAMLARRALGHPALVAVGRRSYGLYLWHWPVFVVTGATDGGVARFVVAGLISVALAEVSLRLIEQPFRRGVDWRVARRRARTVVPMGATAALVLVVAGVYVRAEPTDVAAGGAAVAFELSVPVGAPITATTDASTVAAPAVVALPPTTTTPVTAPATAPVTAPATSPVSPATTAPPAPTAPPALPVRVGLVGDSQAHSLAVNLPEGIEQYFDIDDGSVEGCSVYDTGVVRSARERFRYDFAGCAGWRDDWIRTAERNDVVLVVLGAWDVFDVEVGGTLLELGTPAHDARFRDALRGAIDEMAAVGATAALLEIPCMRPVDARGAGTPPLPERGDDARVAHLNALLREVADSHPAAELVTGPPWCSDEVLATDTDQRWDGVHVYRAGAASVFEAIAPALLALAPRA